MKKSKLSNTVKGVIDLGLNLVSKKASEKQEREHQKIAEENQRKFMEMWEEKYSKQNGKDVEGREPLDLFKGDNKNE